MAVNVTDTSWAVNNGRLTEEQVLIISVAGACAALTIFVLVAVVCALIGIIRRHHSPRRFSSQVSVARSDFWPFAATLSRSPTLASPNGQRHVFFEDDPRLTLASRTSHTKQGAQMSRNRVHSLTTLERSAQDVTSLHQPRSRSTSDSDLVMTSLHVPCFVQLLDSSGSLLARHGANMTQFNRGAYMKGHDPFLWKPGAWEDPH